MQGDTTTYKKDHNEWELFVDTLCVYADYYEQIMDNFFWMLYYRYIDDLCRIKVQ